MNRRPAITVVTTSLRRNKLVLASRPRLQVIDVLGTWEAERHNVAATARYFNLPEDEVRAVLANYAENKDAVDRDIEAHRAAQENYRLVVKSRQSRASRG